jgi:hypothetical protein
MAASASVRLCDPLESEGPSGFRRFEENGKAYLVPARFSCRAPWHLYSEFSKRAGARVASLAANVPSLTFRQYRDSVATRRWLLGLVGQTIAFRGLSCFAKVTGRLTGSKNPGLPAGSKLKHALPWYTVS